MNARSRFAWVTLATLVGFVLTMSLGRWQLNRAAEKQALQAEMDAQGSKLFVDAAMLQANNDPKALVQQHALLRGHWAANQTVYLDNRQMNAKVGFFVITPLVLDATQQAIVVQRGWVPRNFIERDKLPVIETPQGSVQVEGRIAPLPSKLFDPGKAVLTAIRQNLDLEQYRAQTGLPLLPVMLQQTGAPSEGLLREWPAVNLGVEKHYGYALQWFGMGALIAFLYLWFQILKPYFHRTKDSTPHA